MDLGLKDRKAIVLGATRGIGRAIATLLAREGVNLAICARNGDQVAATVSALEACGVRVVGNALDVADAPALQAWIAQMAAVLGGVDILVCNPSAGSSQSAEDPWQRHFRVDLMGAVEAAEAAIPFLKQAAAARGDAAVVIISSAAAAQADRDDPYGPMKAALIHLAKGLSRRLAADHVRVNTVSPGTIFFENGFWDGVRQHHPDLFEEYLRRNPMGRMGTAEEVANAAVFLASPAASFITGSNLVVDGAMTSRVNY